MSDQNQPEIGEGNYEAAREYDERTQKFVKEHEGEIADMAEDAADALDGPEGADLEQAEAEGRSHAKS